MAAPSLRGAACGGRGDGAAEVRGTICPCDARRARAPPLCLADFALPRASCWMSTPLTLTATPTTLGTSRLVIAFGAQGRRPPGGATAPAWLSLRGGRRRSSAGRGDRPAVRTGREAVRRHLAFTRQQQQHSSSTAHPPPHPWGPPRTARHRALANTPRNDQQRAARVRHEHRVAPARPARDGSGQSGRGIP